MAPTPRKEIEIPDPETGETVCRDAMIHIKCIDCGQTWALEFDAGHLTGPCPECSRNGTAQTREPVSLSLTIPVETFVNIDTGQSEVETGGFDTYLDHATVCIRRYRHLTTEKAWHLETVERVDNQTHFHLYRDITPDDEIDYDTLLSWEEDYRKELEELKRSE